MKHKQHILILSLFSCFIFQSLVHANDFIVSIDQGEYLSRAQSNGTVLSRNTSAALVIQKTLDQLKPSGGSIQLLSGDYKIEHTLKIPDRVTFFGMGVGTVLSTTEAFKGESVLQLQKIDRSTIKDLSIQIHPTENKHSGIIIEQSGSCVIENVTVTGASECGIWMRDRSFLCEIKSCQLADSKRAGIFLQKFDGDGKAGDFIPNLITNCTIFGGGYGIECDMAILANIIGCQIFMTNSYGIYAYNFSDSVLITACRTFQVRSDALVFENAHEVNISGNIFCWQEGHGIVLNGTTWGTVSNNQCIDSGHINIPPTPGEPYSLMVDIPEGLDIMENLKCGIRIINGAKGLTISDNAIYNWGTNPPLLHGIFEDETCSNNLISGNNLNYSRKSGVLAQGNNSSAVDNLSVDEKPYMGAENIAAKRLHRYNPAQLEQWIKTLKNVKVDRNQ